MERTQVPLVLGLLALLVLLLVGRSISRRQAQRRAAQTETTPSSSAVQQPEPEDTPEVEAVAQPEPVVVVEASEPQVEPEVEAEQSAPQPEQAARRRGLLRWRRRRGTEVLPAPVVEKPPFEVEVQDVESTPDVTPDQAELRALREQLRALEQVVQQQAADHPTAALARVEENAAEQSAAYLRQVSYVVRGLAAHTSEDEDPRRTLARVAAAVERLGVPNQMERPILPMTNELSSRSTPDPLESPSHRADTAEQADGEHPAPAAVHPPVEQPVEPSIPAALVVAAPAVPAPAVPAPVAAVPSYTELEAAARYEEAVVAVDDAVVPELEADLPAASEPEEEGGIPAYQDSETILPVPPPAAPQPTRRRGLLRKSR